MRLLFITIFFLFQLFCSGQALLKDQASGLSYIVRNADNPRVVVVLIHGYGSNEKDLYSLSGIFPNDVMLVFPRGPIAYSNTSFSWYDIGFKADGNHERNMDQAYQSNKQLVMFIESISNTYLLPQSKLVVGGFSQGAILSVNMCVENPHLMDGVIGLSGTLLHESVLPINGLSEQYKEIHVFYAHGTNDKLLPIHHGRKVKELLINCGVQLDYREYTIEHTIQQNEIKDLISWFNSYF